MTKKAYIVANEKQEREVLEKFERDGIVWVAGIEKPTEWIPSQLEGAFTAGFPYALVIDNKGRVSWSNIRNLTNQKIVYDGRKREEEQMSEKYVVSQEFMNTLVKWKDEHETELEVSLTKLIDPHEVTYLATIVDDWWLDSNMSNIEQNNHLIAIIRWVNGEDVFEIEKPKKWVVRSKEGYGIADGETVYGWFTSEFTEPTLLPHIPTSATRFDTKEEAESWANSHQEVVEVVDV